MYDNQNINILLEIKKKKIKQIRVFEKYWNRKSNQTWDENKDEKWGRLTPSKTGIVQIYNNKQLSREGLTV